MLGYFYLWPMLSMHDSCCVKLVGISVLAAHVNESLICMLNCSHFIEALCSLVTCWSLLPGMIKDGGE